MPPSITMMQTSTQVLYHNDTLAMVEKPEPPVRNAMPLEQMSSMAANALQSPQLVSWIQLAMAALS